MNKLNNEIEDLKQKFEEQEKTASVFMSENGKLNKLLIEMTQKRNSLLKTMEFCKCKEKDKNLNLTSTGKNLQQNNEESDESQQINDILDETECGNEDQHKVGDLKQKNQEFVILSNQINDLDKSKTCNEKNRKRKRKGQS